MATKIVTPDADGEVVIGGLFAVPVGVFAAAPVGDATRKGLKVCDERMDVIVPDMTHGGHTTYSIVCSIVREPRTPEEQAKVEIYAAGVDGRKATKEEKERLERDRTERRMFELGLTAGERPYQALRQAAGQIVGR